MYLLLHCYPLFQFTSPYGDERIHRIQGGTKSGHFNSRLLTETNELYNQEIDRWSISIHVSLRRRTDTEVAFAKSMTISIHVSLRRRTFLQHFTYSYFHISTHVSARRRTIQEYCRRIWGVISIHVSVRRRT